MSEPDFMKISGEVADEILAGRLDRPSARARLHAAGYDEPSAWDIVEGYFEPLDRAEALRLVAADRVKLTADFFFVIDGTIRKDGLMPDTLNALWINEDLIQAPDADWPDGLSPVSLTDLGKAALNQAVR